MRLVVIFAQEWVRITGTKDRSALKVALHQDSYALLDSRTTAMKYVSKYMSKGSAISEEGQSIGRSWGIMGNIPMAKPERTRLTALEPTMLLFLLRRYVKHKKSGPSSSNRVDINLCDDLKGHCGAYSVLYRGQNYVGKGDCWVPFMEERLQRISRAAWCDDRQAELVHFHG